MGGILGHVAIIIGLGTMLGAILEVSGGAEVLASRLLNLFGEKRAPLAMGLTGLIFGIPVFFDVGIFVLAPIVYAAAKRSGKSILLYCMPLLAGLSMTHAFLPPHPGPVAAAGLLNVRPRLGHPHGHRLRHPRGARRLGLRGLDRQAPLRRRPAGHGRGGGRGQGRGRRGAAARPASQPREDAGPARHRPRHHRHPAAPDPRWRPSPPSPWTPRRGRSVIEFFGHPFVALTIALLLAYYLLGIRRGWSRKSLETVSTASLKPVGNILLVVGAGGIFGAVLKGSGVAQALSDTFNDVGLPVIVLAYLISLVLRVAQGSATVAIVTTAGIVAPLLVEGDHSQAYLALVIMAISAGSIFASHVNDGGFWMVAQVLRHLASGTRSSRGRCWSRCCRWRGSRWRRW